ncbi:MAG TPA: carboxypeptidase-like regulatory domain-containing protein [Pirellulales bacterium]|jgi:5-hydroxyisourate hydrolase-like protein (transthyretin family)
MRVTQRCHLLGLSLLAACAFLPRAILAEAPIVSATGTVAGRVVDRQGHGVAGATVRIQESRGDESLATATSAADGKFALDQVPIGCRRLVLIDAEGLGREFRNDVAVFPDRTSQLGDIRALPGYVCRGRVIDAAGQPVAGVAVVVQASRHESGHEISHFGQNWQIQTAADGRFTSPMLPTCYATFAVKQPPGLVQGNNVDCLTGPDIDRFDLPDARLIAETPLDGVVTDERGDPIAGAEVWCNFSACENVKSDRQGHFALHGLTAGDVARVRVGAEAPGFGSYVERQQKVELPGKIVLHPCRYIVGQTVDAETGQPVSLNRLIVCEVRRGADGTPHSYGCGEVRFQQPRPGEFRATVSSLGDKHLTATAQGYRDAEVYVLGFDRLGGEPVVTIKLRRRGSAVSAAGQRIRGVVHAGGKPAGQVWVSLWKKAKEPDSPSATLRRGRTVDGSYHCARVDALTAADGSYLLDVADPGEYYVTARPLAGAPAASPALAIGSGADLTCDLDLPVGGTIRGRVKDVSPDCAERLWVVAFARRPYCAAVPVDRDGRFVVAEVPPGEIGLKVGHEGYLDSDVPRAPFAEDAWQQIAEPWKRATLIDAGANQEIGGIELEYPAPGPPDRVDD